MKISADGAARIVAATGDTVRSPDPSDLERDLNFALVWYRIEVSQGRGFKGRKERREKSLQTVAKALETVREALRDDDTRNAIIRHLSPFEEELFDRPYEEFTEFGSLQLMLLATNAARLDVAASAPRTLVDRGSPVESLVHQRLARIFQRHFGERATLAWGQDDAGLGLAPQPAKRSGKISIDYGENSVERDSPFIRFVDAVLSAAGIQYSRASIATKRRAGRSKPADKT